MTGATVSRSGAQEQADPMAAAARIEAAGGRCECTGACGHPHLKGGGQCITVSRAGRGLILAPATPVTGWVSAARAGVNELRVWCPSCLTGTERVTRRDRAQAAHDEQTALFGGDSR